MSLRMAKPNVAARPDRPPNGTSCDAVEAVLTERNVQVGREVRERIVRPTGDCRPTVALWRPGSNTWPRDQVGRADRAVVDVQVEVDADPLEEAVVEPDEADFDRDLQILQAAELLEQVGDFLVHGLRLADDQAEVRGERPNFGLAAAVFGPRFGRHGGDDQVDERIEVGVRAAAHAARPGADRHRRRRQLPVPSDAVELLCQHVVVAGRAF